MDIMYCPLRDGGPLYFIGYEYILYNDVCTHAGTRVHVALRATSRPRGPAE